MYAPVDGTVVGITPYVVADLSRVERQALARYTNDSGNHVSVELRPAASLVLN